MRWRNLALAASLSCLVACGGAESRDDALDTRADASTEVDGSEVAPADAADAREADNAVPADTAEPPPDTAEPELAADVPADAPAPEADALAPCPPEMALVADAFCIDRWEAALEERSPEGTWGPADPTLTVGDRPVRAVAVEGRVPQAYLSGLEAEAACAAAGKRLCTSDEWLAACRGPQQTTWPYGDAHVDGACNDDYPGHPVVDYFGTSEGVWDAAHLNDPGIDQMPGTVAPAGAHPQCVSAWGVADLHGNLHEWVADVEGTFRGGFYADGAINGAGCLYVTTAHAAAYHDYSTGFRCCRTP